MFQSLKIYLKPSTSLSRRSFFNCNGNLLNTIRQQSTKPKDVKILKSSMNPWQRMDMMKRILNEQMQQLQNSPLSRSPTWKSYNQYYNRTSWDKLKKPLLFTIAFCVGTTFATPYLIDYTPLSIFKKYPQSIIWTIIGLNGIVFFMWRIPQLQRFTMQYGILFKDNIQSPWTLLGSAFSHQSFAHFAINMLCFQSFAVTLVAVLGVSNFTILYLNSAVISSFASIAIPMLLGSSLSVASLGASGAIFSVFGCFSYLFPASPVGLFFIPVPGGAWVLFLGTVIWNAAGTALRWGTFDYAAHLGGSIVGIAYGYYFNRKRKEQIRKRRLILDF
ncbi:uncharacterized protein KGF55_000370 [Candida pseudojiufengensis]|uniref:uncharacterized protein n=1 Tax=Candida pseudojiufengensis TaxID=497109 RepID=UPI0022254573|nr:uncharacterized protein KGF55_000370 [Candida pseudojiufengensis]KAI5966961.1 hypothetical protein KGF55_000370 [Candida pseudojiufengensis]